MFERELKKFLIKILRELRIDIPEDKIILEHPADLAHGDYSTNIALAASKELGKAPRDLADKIEKAWQETGLPDYVSKIEVAPPGFLNIWLKFDALGRKLAEVLKQGERYGSANMLEGKRILLEHTSPNPQTTIMLGHLRNNFLGMSVAKILTFLGAKVTLDDIVNDRGTHICRSIFGYLVFAAKDNGLNMNDIVDFRKLAQEKVKDLAEGANWQENLKQWLLNPKQWWVPEELKLKPDHANLIWYVLGSQAYKVLPTVEIQVEEILRAWEREDKDVRKIWRRILDWSEAGYAATYKRIGSHHDWVWYESDHWKEGKEIVQQGLKKGVFRKSKGAIVTNLENFDLPDTVVVKADGTVLYITQDLALTKLKKEKFPSDLYVWDIGEEQTLYFKQLFAICEQLGFGERNKFFHLSYALINFKGGGKMATRKGNVVTADETLDELHKKALEIIRSSNQELRGELTSEELDRIAEVTALGAIKYSLLKFGRQTTIYFDSEESLSLQGNSGPYLQYTFARTQSVLANAKRKTPARLASQRETGRQNAKLQLKAQKFNFGLVTEDEKKLLRTLYKFSEIVAEAAKTYSPNLICNFLFDLARKFNLFYDKERIIGSENEEFRVMLTAGVGQVLKNGLDLLGIKSPERM